LGDLLQNPERRARLAENAQRALAGHQGATRRAAEVLL
jgi:hypothetical protein